MFQEEPKYQSSYRVKTEKRVKKLLKSDDLWKYELWYEITPSNKIKGARDTNTFNFEGKNSAERYYEYEKISGGVECDQLFLTQYVLRNSLNRIGNDWKLYGKSWEYRWKIKYTDDVDYFLSGDSLTSVHTVLNSCFKKDYAKSLNEKEEAYMSDFAKIGNYFLDPLLSKSGSGNSISINSLKSGFGKNDFADILLFAIRNYYIPQKNITYRCSNSISELDDITLKELVTDEGFTIAKVWLNIFSIDDNPVMSWNRFVEQNLFQDSFVEKCKVKVNGSEEDTWIPKKLWKNHKLGSLPENHDDLEEFLDAEHKAIELRGKNIQARLNRVLFAND